ncbi:MAG: TIGR03084 family metal-binding protein [Sporichthyaceae bacterium]
MAASMSDLVTDLAAETEVIESMLSGLSAAGWDTPTPAAGWSIRDQIAHLAYFDEAAVAATIDPAGFKAEAAAQMALGMDFPDRLVVAQRALGVAELHAWFRRARLALIAETGERDPKERVPWYGPAMSLASCVTARIMETWAHGQDIADARGITREPSMRLRHIAHIGVGAMTYSFMIRELAVPSLPIRVEVIAPDGALWTWGPEGAGDLITGTALDFCLVVTQRRHREDTDLKIVGPAATAWMGIAQAFAGAPGPGRAPAFPAS